VAFGDADASTPAFVKANDSSKAATTASFTPPVGALLVAFAFHDTAGGNLTNTSDITDSQGLTWTKRVTHSKQDDGSGANNGHVQISTAVVASSVSMTVTTTGTNCNNPAALYVRVITSADTTTPMDATPTEGHNTNAVISQAIVTATDGARAFLIACDWNLAANMTAGTNQTAVVSDGIGAPDMRVYVGVQNAVTSPAGSTTMSTASPSTGNTNNYAVIALRPAAGGGTVTGAAAALLGALAATAVGTPTTFGTAASALGGLTATAVGVPTTFGTAASTLGVLAATAAGTRTVLGVAVAPLGQLAAAAMGGRQVTGTAATALGALAATAVGGRQATGTAAAALGALLATVSGTVHTPVLGTASALLGALAATATGATPDGESTGPRLVTSSRPRTITTASTARTIVTSSGGPR